MSEQLFIEGLEPSVEERMQQVSYLLGEAALATAVANRDYKLLQEQRSNLWRQWLICSKVS